MMNVRNVQMVHLVRRGGMAGTEESISILKLRGLKRRNHLVSTTVVIDFHVLIKCYTYIIR